MFKIVLLLACIPAIALAAVSKCSSGALPEDIRNNICELDGDVCPIEVGIEIEFELDFVATSASEKVLPSVVGKLGILNLPIVLTDEAQIGCNSIYNSTGDLGCPIVAGEFYTYKMDLVVESLPISGGNTKLDVQIALTGDSEVLSCFAFPAVV